MESKSESMSSCSSVEKSGNKLIWSSRRSIESDRPGTGREKQTSNQLMPADRIQTYMSGLDICRGEMADNKLRGAGSKSIERERPTGHIQRWTSLTPRERNLQDNIP